MVFRSHHRSLVAALAALGLVAAACTNSTAASSPSVQVTVSTAPTAAVSTAPPVAAPRGNSPVVATSTVPSAPVAVGTPSTQTSTAPTPAPRPTLNVYSRTGSGDLSPAVAGAKPYVYVPSNDTGTVTVIDQASLQVIDNYRVGKLVQHVVPSWDLTTLYALASDSNRLVPIDPATGKPGKAINVEAPYNLYFSPDGTQAIVMAERRNSIDIYDPHTWKKVKSVPTKPCVGNNHADWSGDLSFFLVTCEFSGQIVKVDATTDQIVGQIDLGPKAMPQDLRLAPDGSKFYVADMNSAGVWVIDALGTRVIGKIATDVGAHGIYPSRDGRLMYVSNRGRADADGTGPSRDGQGSISVIDPTTDQVMSTWHIPGGGSPDMGGVSADGTQLWLSGRYDSVVYVFSTGDGALLAKIAVPRGPHGLCVFPQPGRFSLGHTGNYR